MSDEEKGSCLNKFRYESFYQAEKIARHSRHRIYKCRFCGGYHLTHEKPKEKPNDDYHSKRNRRFGKRSWSEDYDTGA